MSDVLTSVTANLARITLNRPEALHALTTHMCANMTQPLLRRTSRPGALGFSLAA